MSRRRLFLAAAGMLALALIVGPGSNPARAQLRPLMPPLLLPAPTDGADPVPIRRVLIPLERVYAEIERAGVKKLVHLSQQEFNARLRAARLAQTAQLEPPRLVETHYRASLIDSVLVGSADWNLSQSGTSPGVLPVRPFNLALRSATLDGAPAILGDVESRSLGLLVETAGPHRLNLEWSVRGEARPNELRFDLRLPACVITTFDIDLPAGSQLSARRDQCLVSGPFPSKLPGRERWQLEVLNRSRFELFVRSANRQDRGEPLVVARVEERQNLTIDQVELIQDVKLEVNRGPMREFDFDLSPDLQPIALNYRGNELEGWELRPPPAGSTARRLHVKLPEALQGMPATLRIRALAPLPLNREWHSPFIQLQNAVVLSESLMIQAAPAIELTDWHAGRFDLLKTSTDAIGAWVIQLQANPFASAQPVSGAEGRPWARPRLPITQATAGVQLWWNIEPVGERLLARVRLEPHGGPLFRVQCRLPVGWRVDRTELQPAGSLVDWVVLEGDATGRLLLIHLNEAIEPSQVVTLLLTLARPPQMPAGGERAFAIPALELLNTQAQETWLGVSVASQLRVKSTPAGTRWDARWPTPSDRTAAKNADVPLWADQPLWGLTSFHRTAPAGQIVVEGLTARIRGQAAGRLDLSMDPPQVGLRLTAESAAGAIHAFDVQFNAPLPQTWQWTGPDGRPVNVQPVPGWESLRLPGISSTSLDLVTTLAVGQGRHNLVRFSFAEPFIKRQLIETGPHPAALGQAFEFPLPLRIGNLPVAGEMELSGVDNARASVTTRGLDELPAADASSSSGDSRRYAYEGGAPSLRLHSVNEAAAPAEAARVSDIALLTTVERSGHVRERLTFHVHPNGALSFPLLVPIDSTIVSLLVDRRWADSRTGEQQGDFRILKIPTPASQADSSVEVTWEREVPAWLFWARIHDRLPRFPVATGTWKRAWSLAPGLAPASLQNLEPLPGLPGSSSGWNIDAWVRGRLAPRRDRALAQQLIAEADVRLRAEPAGDVASAPLGDRLQVLVRELTAGKLGLVVDCEALRAAGLTQSSLPSDQKLPADGTPRSSLVLSAACLEPFGLELLATRPVPLLTTPRARLALGAGEPSEATETAILQAARLGRDATGRYRNAITWLDGCQRETLVDPLPGNLSNPLPNWPTWLVASGSSDVSALTIVRLDSLTLVGYLLLCGLAGLCWILRKRSRALFGLICCLLPLLLLGWAIVPPHLARPLAGPATWGLLIGLGLLLLRRAGAPGAASPSGVSGVVAILTLALATGVAGWAAGPTEFTVLLLSEDGGKKIGVLAPTELLESLNALVQRGQQPLERPVLLGAHYRGTAHENSAAFEADFDVYSPSTGTVDWTLPLGSVELLAATCDQQPALPVAGSAPQGGYVFRLQGKGTHRVQLRFAIAMAVQAGERECHVAIPETLLTRVAFLAPAGSTRLLAVGARGLQQQSTTLDGVRLSADLGRIPQLQVRWNGPDPAGERPALDVKELYLWDLQSARRLLAVLRYQVARGSVSSLLIDIPFGWDVRQVETVSLTGSSTNWLRDWSIVAGAPNKRLRLDFQSPLTSGVQVSLELLNRAPATNQATLALPTPLGANSSGGMLAYHVGRGEAVLKESLGFTGVDLESFSALWQKAGVEDPGAPTRAFSFRRSSGQALTMHLELRALASGCNAVQNLVWRPGRSEFHLEASLQLAGHEEDLALVEWQMPAGLHLDEIVGTDVHSWSITGQHVQVWLRPGLTRAALTWRGWQASPPVPDQILQLPMTRLSHTARLETNLLVETVPGCSLSARELKYFRPQPAAPGVLAFSSDQPNASCTIQVAWPASAGAAQPAEKPSSPTKRPEAGSLQELALLSVEQAARWQSGGGWLHCADYDFLGGAGRFQVSAPPAGKLLAAYLNDQPMPLREPSRLGVPVDGQLRRHHLRVTWNFEAGRESAGHPDLAPPVLENIAIPPGLRAIPGVWKIIVPADFRVEPVAVSTARSNPALLFLDRAAASLRLAGRAASSKGGLAREAELMFRRASFAASAWLAQAPALQEAPESIADLLAYARKLEQESGVLAQNAMDPGKRSGADSIPGNLFSGRRDRRERNGLPAQGCSSEQGRLSYWTVAGGESCPQVQVAYEGGGALLRWRQALLALLLATANLAILARWIADSSRVYWQPELGLIWSLLAGALAASWTLTLFLLAACLLWRLAVLVGAWLKQRPADPSNLAEPVQTS
jgi:hypothetical protein